MSLLLWSINGIFLLLRNFFKSSLVSLALSLYQSLLAMMSDITTAFLSVLTDVPRATISREMSSWFTICRKSLVPQWSTMTSGATSNVPFYGVSLCSRNQLYKYIHCFYSRSFYNNVFISLYFSFIKTRSSIA